MGMERLAKRLRKTLNKTLNKLPRHPYHQVPSDSTFRLLLARLFAVTLPARIYRCLIDFVLHSTAFSPATLRCFPTDGNSPHDRVG